VNQFSAVQILECLENLIENKLVVYVLQDAFTTSMTMILNDIM
jgi:hypothetical protein